MDVREKLVELIKEGIRKGLRARGDDRLDYSFEDVADHLISNGVTVQEWISVADRLPDNKKHDLVLAQVVEDNGFMHIPNVMEYRQQRNDWLDETYGWLSEHNGAFTVTHWMPLPEPPKCARMDGDDDAKEN